MTTCRSIIAALLALIAGAAADAAPMCTVPAPLATPTAEGPTAKEPARTVPIGGYTLSLIWLAQNCHAGGSSGAGALDCRAHAGRRGFVLHGLWPDGTGSTWPQWCAPADPLPATTLRAHYCATPSTQLIQHEWSKHGTCMPGYDPDRYLALARRLFGGLNIPDVAALTPGKLTAGAVQQAFAHANRGLDPDMLRLNINREGWLEEVWVCLDADFRRQHCPATQGGAQGDTPVQVWRGSR